MGQNLLFVSLCDIFVHIDEWVVDWDMNLTSKEIDLVMDPTWRATLLSSKNDCQGLRYSDVDYEAMGDPQDKPMHQYQEAFPGDEFTLGLKINDLLCEPQSALSETRRLAFRKRNTALLRSLNLPTLVIVRLSILPVQYHSPHGR
jgi:hypothetical protein